MNREKPREIAIRVLVERGGGADFVENLVDRELTGSQLSAADRGLIQELIFGVIRWQKTLDWLIARKTKGQKQRKPVQNLLRLGLYQLFWLDRIPDHAAVDETVELAKTWAGAGEARFVNAVLRGYGRARASTIQALADLKKKQPALGYSFPEWLCQRWISRWGGEKTDQLLEWNNTPPKTFARVNQLKIQPPDLHRLWKQEGVQFQPDTAVWAQPAAFCELMKFPPLATLGTFRSGFFYIQDPSTALAVRELDPHPGETVLDSCAAPGGKATLIAERMRNEGRIVAEDLNPERLRLLRENCQRLGTTNLQIGFPSQYRPALPFDKVLVDAPCSNTGVMRRRIELRWRIREQELARLHGAQVELLRGAASRTKPGGRLVYSTCSLEPEENEEAKNAFLAAHPNFQLEAERMLTPFDGVDGAYVARFRRE